MANPVIKQSQKRFRGISDYLKETLEPDSFVFAKSINYRHDPNSITLLPGALKESGSVVTDLIKWGETVPTLTKYFFYGNTGNIYQRTSTPTWTNLHTAPSSHGNGLAYFTGDDYLYYTADSVIGRYGQVSGSSPQFSDNFLQAQGGVPLNTASILLASASSMYGHAADSTSLSITSDLTLETYFKANTLPTAGNTMTLLGKWDESGTLRSYIMDIAAISGYFGTGGDGALTISSNTTEAPIDSACTGTATTQTLTATNASFAQGQVIFIWQTQGTNAGQWERNTIQGYTAGTITTGTPLLGTYVSGAQVRVLKQYSSVTINSGITYTAKAWNGTTGGILSFLCSGTLSNSGTISANGVGFRGGVATNPGTGEQGEGTLGAAAFSTSANGNGGGGGSTGGGGGAAGGGGANGAVGSSGGPASGGGAGTQGAGGAEVGATDLTTMDLGGGGGGGAGIPSDAGGAGGNGGGVIFLIATSITNTGTIVANGATGSGGAGNTGGGGGGGGGGSILLKAQTATLGTLLLSATGGVGGGAGSTNQNDHAGPGGAGGTGRIVLDYLTSFSGTSTPTLNAIQDSSLVTTVTYQLRLGVSSTGTNSERLTMNLPTLTTGTWNRASITWKASTSVATFYLNAVSLGTFTGTFTAIHDNASLLYAGANKGASVVGNFFDGLLNDMRIISNVQTAGQILANNQIQLASNYPGLQAYYKFNSTPTDSTSNANDLTLVNTPTYSSDVPFPAPSTRLDLDQSSTTTGSTYSLLTAISESASNSLSFTPTDDPQKSISFSVNAKGTGNWTVTIHDQQNNVIATQTILNAQVPASGAIEFTFTTPWRLVIGKTYHAHLTVSTGTSSVVTSASSNFATAVFSTYFAFLVTDTAYHPVVPFLNFVAIGNERYIAKWDGAFYSPNFITFPPGWRVRCFGFWREYLAIGVWKGTNIYDYDFGRIYFWDGISPTFNFSIDVGDGQINALYGVDTDLYIMAGWRGYLLDYQGGFFYNTGNTKSNKLKRIPNNRDFLDTDYAEVFPGAFRMWRNLLQIGMAGNSNSTTIQRGVYSWGSYNQDYKDSLSFDYPISTGNVGNTVSIGCVYPAGKQLIIGWQDGIAFGADVIDYANPPATSGYLELMLQDDGTIYKQHSQLVVRADHLALTSGASVDVGYQPDRSGTYTLSSINTSTTTPTNQFTKLNIDTSQGRAREYQAKVDLYAPSGTGPTIVGLSLQGDTLEEEKVI